MLRRWFLLSLIAVFALAVNAKLLVRDRALFRIEKQVIFQEGLEGWLKEWGTLKCVGRRSFLLNSLDLNSQDFETVIDILKAIDTRAPTATERELVERMVRLVKFSRYVQTQEMTKEEETQWPQSWRCLDGKQRTNENILILKRAENFLLERFREGEKNRRGREEIMRARSFIESVVRGQSHELFI